MNFPEIIDQATALLQHNGRMSYRALKMAFDLDDEQLDVLKEDLLFSHPEIEEIDGRGLGWNRRTEDISASQSVSPAPQSPASYTPPHLAERILAEQSAMESRGATDGERKTITALFADLKGSTALIEGLDPEDARAIIDPALQLMMDAVHRYDGYVAQALGDGIFALFGAPIAHEDHPRRALYAALRMQDEMQRYSDQSRLKGGFPLQIRVGINTGEVVVRSIHKDDLHTDYVPVGHSTNLASRMEQIATPGSIVISEYTRKLTEGYFDLKALGAAEIKGIEEPLNVYEVLGAGPLRTRLQVSARRGLSRFVGRQNEMDQLRQALAQAKDGHGQIVGVMGEPGLGKSRLFHEFKLTSQSGCLLLEAFSVSHGKASAYLPIIELLKAYLEITLEDDERKRREKVTGKVLDLDRSLEDTLPYFFSLLDIEDAKTSLQQMDPQVRRQRTFEALKRLFLRESLNQPLIVIFEDLHWIDAETQGFLDALSESEASARILLLVNYRPEYRHDWGQKTYYTQLRLTPLGREEAEELLTFLLGSDTSLQDLKQLILERTEGTPFFMEELVQTLAEEGALVGERGNYRLEKAPTELHISPTVQGVLAARIDRLEPAEKALLQQLSVIGREFPIRLVREVVMESEDELYRLLSSLQRKEFLYEQPAFPEVEYIFKHALTQEVACGTVLHGQRNALHERTGEALEALYPDTLEDHYGELAHHYNHSDNMQKAVEYLGLAGQQAQQRSANEEAIGHFTTALELLKTLPDTAERNQQELTLQVALGMPLAATKGWGAPEREKVYRRARELCSQVGETPELFPTLYGLWGSYLVRAEYKAAHEATQQLLNVAKSATDSVLLLGAHGAAGVTLLWLGEIVASREHLGTAMALYEPSQRVAHIALHGEDPGVSCLSYTARALWILGYPHQALQVSQQALTLARESLHPFSLAWALDGDGFVHASRGEWQEAEERVAEQIALATERGFPFWLAWGNVMRGSALCAQGQTEEGMALIRQGRVAYRSTGTEMGHAYSLGLLAEAHGQAGRAEEGLATVDEALTFVEQTGERYCEAELYRLKGELTLQSQAAGQKSKVEGEAVACFEIAREIAKMQSAKSWELRAATSLARLFRQQGKQTKARELLSEIYDWFTEGFDTKDLRDAKALLEELA